ncbi:MAG: enoyl-CoA hydratase-related protein, partial [Acidobacteriota bacterium]
MVSDPADQLTTLRYQEDDQGVGLLTLDRPPVNALGRQLVAELSTILDRLESRKSLRVLVLAGAGRTF